jgi:uncharacterized protein (TIRG00374 family)
VPARAPDLLDTPPCEDIDLSVASSRPRVHWSLVLAGIVSLAVTAPLLGEVYTSFGEALDANRWWVLAALVSVALGFTASWTLQKAALRADRWGDVVAPHLAGNAASNVLPFGSALGSVIQLRMLRRNGFDLTRSLTALTIAGMLSTVAGLLVFPLLVVVPVGDTPGFDTDAMARGGLVVLAVAIVVVTVVLRSDRPMRLVANGVHSGLRRLPRCRPRADLADHILRERDEIRTVLTRRKLMTVTTSVARVLGDYFALYAAMCAVGLRPSPVVVLVAFVAANAAGMVPVTPGGLGFVEAGLTGAIVLAGAADDQALAAVAIYRLASCWLPVLAGVGAYAWSRRQVAAPVAAVDTDVALAVPELSVA